VAGSPGVGLSPFVVYLLGYPAVGKYTVGRALASHTRALLIDNHLVNYPILAVLDWDGTSLLPPGTLERTAPIRDAVFAAIDEIAPRSLSYVFTNVLEDQPEDVAIYQRLQGVAERRGSLFLPVMLSCEREVQLERVESEERARRFKVSRRDHVEHHMATVRLYNPADPNLLKLDTTARSAEESAASIIERLVQLS